MIRSPGDVDGLCSLQGGKLVLLQIHCLAAVRLTVTLVLRLGLGLG